MLLWARLDQFIQSCPWIILSILLSIQLILCAKIPVEALKIESNNMLATLPNIINVGQLSDNPVLVGYKKAAMVYQRSHPLQNERVGPEQGERMWNFWREHIIQLPVWFQVAEEFVLIMTPSARVKRILSLYVSMFGTAQQSVLEDRREGSVSTKQQEAAR